MIIKTRLLVLVGFVIILTTALYLDQERQERKKNQQMNVQQSLIVNETGGIASVMISTATTIEKSTSTIESTPAIERVKELGRQYEAAQRVTEVTEKELKDLGVVILGYPNDSAEPNAFLQRVKQNPRLRDLIKLAKKNGVRVCVFAGLETFKIGYDSLFIDITATDERIIKFLKEGK